MSKPKKNPGRCQHCGRRVIYRRRINLVCAQDPDGQVVRRYLCRRCDKEIGA